MAYFGKAVEARAWLEQLEERMGVQGGSSGESVQLFGEVSSERKHGNGSVAGGARGIKGERG